MFETFVKAMIFIYAVTIVKLAYDLYKLIFKIKN